MQERQLVKQLKELRSVKPNKDWVIFTKEKIFAQAQEEERTRIQPVYQKAAIEEAEKGKRAEKRQLLGWLFNPLKRPGWVLRPAVAVSLILAGVFSYLYFNSQVEMPYLANIPIKLFNPEKVQLEAEMLVVSLGKLKANLGKITASLDNLKYSKYPNEALAVTEAVRVTANQGEEIVKEIKTRARTDQVLSSLIEMENEFKTLSATSSSLQQELLASYIEDLRQRSLSEEDQERLQRAEEYYNEGRETEAMLLIMRIGSDSGNDI